MQPWQIFLIVFGVTLLLIIIIASRKKKKKKKPSKSAQTYLNYGDYLSAGRLYLKQKNEVEAAELYFKTPPDKRPQFESMVEQQLGRQGAQLFWIKTGRRLERLSTEKAKIAYLLAGAYFDAVKMFVDKNDTKSAIDLIKYIPPNFQENTVRRLSQYSFNRGKYRVASDLLRAIALVEEADAILAVGAHDYQTIERPEVAANMYDDVGRQDLVGESQEQQGERALSKGRVKEAKVAFKKAVKAYDESSQPKEALRIEQRLEKFDLLDKFREYASKGNTEAAEDMIDEISDNFPKIAVSDLYAEIAGVLERNSSYFEAVTYYDKAADSTNNPLKKQGYVNALRRLGSRISNQSSQGEIIAQENMKENCIVCRRPMSKGQRIVCCPFCQKYAHYSHLVEWIKVQGTCPNCHKKLRVSDFLES